MFPHLRPAVVLLAAFTLLTGFAYPWLVTAIAGVAFPVEAAGSLIRRGDAVVGSRLVCQPFSDPAYFWPRPSATAPTPCNGAASSGSNLGPTNPARLSAIRDRVAALRAADPANTALVPADLVTTSASGLDPHVSPAGALYQVPRVARLRALPESVVRDLAMRHVEPPQFGLFGEPRVNVLELNLALDTLGRGQ